MFAELPTPTTPKITFINISSVNISWDFSAVDPVRNVCFVIEYQNNTRYANVSSLICEGNHTFYVFPWLLRGQSYRFRIYATDGIMTTVSKWSFFFRNGIEGTYTCKISDSEMRNVNVFVLCVCVCVCVCTCVCVCVSPCVSPCLWCACMCVCVCLWYTCVSVLFFQFLYIASCDDDKAY